jgi:ATP-binding cassette subfamily F protein 3
MLKLIDVTLQAYGRTFLSGANVALRDGARVGLVGRNGVGKSTLFKLLLGEMQAQTGEVLLPKGRVAAVEQEAGHTSVPLIDTVLGYDRRRAALMASLDTAPPEKLGEIHAELIDIGAEAAPARAAEILAGLGFKASDLKRPTHDFSGGWRMRAALAGALLAQPELLLLDEPTNYLDLEGALWLEARLKRYPRTALMISHDRELLNGACDFILHLHDGVLDLYQGDYDSFETQRAERQRHLVAAKSKQDAERAHLQSFVDRFKAKASKAAQAQSRVKRLAKLKPVEITVEGGVQPFYLPSPQRSLAPPLIRMEGVSTGYDGPPILTGLNLRLDTDDRIGLLGVNGAGKSTFAKLLAGALKPQGGTYTADRRMRVAWFHQHQIEALDPDECPIDLMRRALPEASEAERRSKLAQFGLPAIKVETSNANLSGGERARMLLNMVAMQRPHLLILDEPTNHLDIDSRRALLDAINDYDGAVVLVTHDRGLMEMVADRLWLADEGHVKPFDGDMDDYTKYVLDRARVAARASSPKNAKKAGGPDAEARKKAAADARAQVAPLRRAMEDAEKRMNRAATELAAFDKTLSDPALFVREPRRAVALGKERGLAAAAVERAEAAWMRAAEAYETAKAAAGA